MKPWDEMTAKEQNIVLAEEVMEWEKASDGQYRIDETTWIVLEGVYPDNFGFWSPVRHIVSAWDVVNRMKELGWNMSLNNASIQFGGEHWVYVCFANGEHQVRAQAPTAPEAISKAAVKAIRKAKRVSNVEV